MLKPLLVILTMTSGGDTHLALSSPETQADCEARQEVVSQTLAAAGAQVLAAVCGESDLSFTPYAHGAPASAFTHRWRVHLTDGGPVIAPVAQGAACDEQRDAMQPSFCAVSAQSVTDASTAPQE